MSETNGFGAALGDLLPSVLDAELWDAQNRQALALAAEPFRIAPFQPGDPVTWPVPMTNLGPVMRPWNERWDTFLSEVVAPVVAPIATALPLAIPYAAHLLGGTIEGVGQAVTFPDRAMRGEFGDPSGWSRDPAFIGEALNLAGLLTPGSLTPRFSRPRGAPSVTSRSANYVAGPDRPMYNPPLNNGPRSFNEVYPNGVQTNEAGRPLFDVDGNPIHPDATIVGLASRAGARATSPEEFADIGFRTVGAKPISHPRGALEGNSGGLYPEFGENGEYLRRGYIAIADDLSPEQRALVSAHEVSHAIDLTANPPADLAAFRAGNWGIRPEDPYGVIEDQLYRIYRDLNNDPSSARQTIFGPADLGYSRTETMAELWDEAIRAYAADRGYIHAVAPDVAQAIRDHVNTHPQLSRIIHFNAGGLPIPAAPIPDTLQGVTLPGGSPVASLGDLMAMGPTPATATVPRQLGPQWAVDYMAAYSDPNSPQWAERIAWEEAAHEAYAARMRQLAREQAIREGRLVEA